MEQVDISQFVHEVDGRWIVARYNADAHQWQAPIRAELRRQNPSTHTIYSQQRQQLMSHAYSYSRRADAMRRAAQLAEDGML